MRRPSPRLAGDRAVAEERLEEPSSRRRMAGIGTAALCVAISLTSAACGSSSAGTAASQSSYPLVYISDEANTGGQPTPSLSAINARIAAANAHGGMHGQP